jgi:hypothetical protein
LNIHPVKYAILMVFNLKLNKVKLNLYYRGVWSGREKKGA